MLPSHPVLSFLTPAILLVIAVCGLTRLVTTLQFYLHPAQSTEPPVLPYWIPYLGHVLDLAPGLQPYLSKQSLNHPSLPVFTFKIGPSKHNVLIAPSLVHQVLAKRENFSKISMRKMVYRTIEVVQGDYKKELRDMSEDTLFGPIHNVLVNMMREDFLHSALAGTVTAVETSMPALISGISTVVDMERWERAAKVEITRTGQGPDDFTARANLFELIRTFVVFIGTDVFKGHEFLANFPGFIDDFWTADAAFTQLMIGVPEWLPSMRAPIRARDRVHSAVLEHRIAHLKYLAGEDPGTKWGNMDDVSTIMRQRAEEWDKGGASADLAARGDTAVLMALNVNAPVLVFWMLWYIYQDPTLLQELRNEVAPYIVVPDQNTTGRGAISEKKSAKINLDGLWKNCPLLLGSFMETMRLESGGLTYKYVTEDFVVEESPGDARLFNKAHADPQPRRYVFRKDDYICIPNGVHAHDTRYFEHPELFDARRFWVADEKHGKTDDETPAKDETKKKPVKVDFKTLKPFGGGKEMCKGRKFAEGEVLLFVAAFVSFWDMQPAEEESWFVGLGEDMGGVLKMGGGAGEGSEGGNAKRVWKDLGRKQGSGSSHPVKIGDCVVELKRRG